MAEISTYNVKYSYSTDDGSTWENVRIKSFPTVLGQRSSIEVTDLSDDAQRFIQGIRQQSDSFDFTANWDKTVFTAINAISSVVKNKMEFSDGTTFTWDGYISASPNEGGVDEVLEMTISTTPTTVPVAS